jgi:hypothetical protein
MTKFKTMSDVEFVALVEKHDREGGILAKQSSSPQGCWDAGIKIIEDCGHIKSPAYLIRFSQKAHEQIECLKRSYPSLEWLAYLEGSVDHVAREVKIGSLIIPDSQIVSAAHVGQVEYSWDQGKQICGVIHSHNTMGAFFSGTDDAYINQNHDVSICVSTAVGREICAQVRVKTPCGSYIINNNIKFKIDYSSVLDEAAFIAEFSPRILTERSVRYTKYNPVHNNRKGVLGANNAHGGKGDDADTESTVQPLHPTEEHFGLDPASVKLELLKFYTAKDVDAIEVDGGIAGLRRELKHCCDALGISLSKGYITDIEESDLSNDIFDYTIGDFYSESKLDSN